MTASNLSPSTRPRRTAPRYQRAFSDLQNLTALVLLALALQMVRLGLPDVAALLVQASRAVGAANAPHIASDVLWTLIAEITESANNHWPYFTQLEITCDRLRVLDQGFASLAAGEEERWQAKDLKAVVRFVRTSLEES